MFENIVSNIRAHFTYKDIQKQPGMSISIRYRGKTESYNFGYASLETSSEIKASSRFHAASLAKQFTSFAITLLEDKQKLSSNDPINKYLADITPIVASKITIRQLLDHTSGIQDQWVLKFLAGWRDDDTVTMEDIVRLFSMQSELNFLPGTEHSYCNTGYSLLALIVEKVSGMSFEDFINDNIFKPAGMKSSVMRRDHNQVLEEEALAYKLDKSSGSYSRSIPPLNVIGATCLITTSEDLINWAEFLYGLDIESKFSPGELNNGEEISYSKGLIKAAYGKNKLFFHGGWDYGYSSLFMIFPDSQLTVSILANGYEPNLEVLGTYIANSVLDLGVQFKEIADISFIYPPTKSIDKAEKRTFSGIYAEKNSHEIISFRVEDDVTILDVAQGYPLSFLHNGEYLIQGTTSRIRVVSPTHLQRSVSGNWLDYLKVEIEHQTIKYEELEGNYNSLELSTFLCVKANKKSINLKFPKGEIYDLKHLSKDTYLFNGMTVSFRKNGEQKMEMTIAHPRAKRNIFIKANT